MGATMLKEKDESEVEINEVFSTKQESEAKLKCPTCIYVKNEAAFICFVCKCYVCVRCMKEHKQHNCFNGMSEGSERERRIESYLRDMENEPNREELFNKEEVSIIDKVNVKHLLDKKPCLITGLCGMDNSGWVACDYENHSIKLLSRRTNDLQRCIRFIPQPFDVTEIIVTQKSTDPVSAPGSCKTNITVTNQSEPMPKCLLAVTLPEVKEIWFIDANQIPAVKTKSIKLQKQCWSVNFCEGQIFTLCSKSRYNSPWVLYVLSLDGDTNRVIPTDIIPIYEHSRSYVSRIAVSPGKVYLADKTNDRVICLNGEGKVICQTEKAHLKGISVDTYNSNNVNLYVWDIAHHKIYQLNSSLDRCESVIDLGPVYLQDWNTLCLYRGKLYISPIEAENNKVLIVRVL